MLDGEQMIIRVENPKLVLSRNDRQYWSFWVRLIDGARTAAFAGWKYFPDTIQQLTSKGGSKEEVWIPY
jgi:hypothetical protein